MQLSKREQFAQWARNLEEQGTLNQRRWNEEHAERVLTEMEDAMVEATLPFGQNVLGKNVGIRNSSLREQK